MHLRLDEIGATPIRLKGRIDLPGVQDVDGEPLVDGPVEFSGTARRGPVGVELRARWKATVRQRCSRCLEPFTTRRDEAFLLVLTKKSAETEDLEHEMQPGDADLYLVDGECASVPEIAAEQIELSLPLKPVCNDDCAGLCPTCGANRNRIECGCRRDEVDPRLAPLRDFKDRIGGG